MPPFAYQFESPPSMLKASSEAFLSNHPSEGPEAFFLPAALSFHPTKEGPLLSNMILDLKLSTLQFKLAPAFALYMIVRYHVSPDFQPGANASELRKHLIVMLKNTVSYMKRAVKVSTQWVTVYAYTFTVQEFSRFSRFYFRGCRVSSRRNIALCKFSQGDTFADGC